MKYKIKKNELDKLSFKLLSDIFGDVEDNPQDYEDLFLESLYYNNSGEIAFTYRPDISTLRVKKKYLNNLLTFIPYSREQGIEIIKNYLIQTYNLDVDKVIFTICP